MLGGHQYRDGTVLPYRLQFPAGLSLLNSAQKAIPMSYVTDTDLLIAALPRHAHRPYNAQGCSARLPLGSS